MRICTVHCTMVIKLHSLKLPSLTVSGTGPQYKFCYIYNRAAEGLYYCISRVPECLSLRPNWLSPPPSPPSEWVPSPLEPKRGATLACGWGGGGRQFRRLERCMYGTLSTMQILRTEANNERDEPKHRFTCHLYLISKEYRKKRPEYYSSFLSRQNDYMKSWRFAYYVKYAPPPAHVFRGWGEGDLARSTEKDFNFILVSVLTLSNRERMAFVLMYSAWEVLFILFVASQQEALFYYISSLFLIFFWIFWLVEGIFRTYLKILLKQDNISH